MPRIFEHKSNVPECNSRIRWSAASNSFHRSEILQLLRILRDQERVSPDIVHTRRPEVTRAHRAMKKTLIRDTMDDEEDDARMHDDTPKWESGWIRRVEILLLAFRLKVNVIRDFDLSEID
jgi:hypothetical protein